MKTKNRLNSRIIMDTFIDNVSNCCFNVADRPRRPRFDTCSIHCLDDESLLISLKDLDSWKSSLKAVTMRNHEASA